MYNLRERARSTPMIVGDNRVVAPCLPRVLAMPGPPRLPPPTRWVPVFSRQVGARFEEFGKHLWTGESGLALLSFTRVADRRGFGGSNRFSGFP